MSPARDTSICARCGMPLAYDSYVTNAEGLPASPDPSLCSACAKGNVDSRTTPDNPDRSWLLDLVFQTYRGETTADAATFPNSAGEFTTDEAVAAEVGELLRQVPEKQGSSGIDGVVLYSGGKDSSWMLTQLARQDIKLVAWMLDQGYQSPAAIRNAQQLCDRLGVELVIRRPEREPMNNLFRIGFNVNQDGDPELIRSAMTYGSACWPCFSTIITQASSFCHDNDVAFCFVGTHKGQNRHEQHGESTLGIKGLPLLSDGASDFTEPLRAHAEKNSQESAELLRTAPGRTVLVPFYEFVPKPPVETIIAELAEIGWHVPNNTGTCSTNCMINELGCKIMRNQYGFDVYQIFDARERRLQSDPEPPPVPALDEDAVRRGARLIGLTPEEEERFGIDS